MPLAFADNLSINSDYYESDDFLKIGGYTSEYAFVDIDGVDFHKGYRIPMMGEFEVGLPLSEYKDGIYTVTMNVGEYTNVQTFGLNVLPECVFTASIEKNIVFTSEKPFVTGFVKNCDVENITYSGNENWNAMKNKVFVRILDNNGDLVDRIDNSKNVFVGRQTPNDVHENHFLNDKFNIASKFNFNDSVYREGSYTGNADVSESRTFTMQNNQFFFYLPMSINAAYFEHGKTYTVELTYMKHTRTVDFLIVDTSYVEPSESAECDNLRGMYNSINVINVNIDSFVNKPLILESQQNYINKIQTQIDELELTCGEYDTPVLTKSTRDFNAISVYEKEHETMEEKRIKMLEAYALLKGDTRINTSNGTNPDDFK